MTDQSMHSDQSSGPLLSAVIETVNIAPGDFRFLEETLEAIAAQTIPLDRIEIIVVADPKVHPSLRSHLTELAPHVRVLEAEGLHYYAQKNLGARHARAALVAFIDSDCLPSPTWAESILKTFSQADESLGAVQGTVHTESGLLASAYQISVFGQLLSNVERRTYSLAASNCAFRRAELIAHPFEEGTVFHGPDVKKAAHLADRGKYILLVPGAADIHRFTPGLLPFIQRGVYWGQCFLELRRAAPPSVRYARLFRAFGPLAPIALAPAKAMLDFARMFKHRADLRMSVSKIIGCSGALLLNSLAVGVGGFKSVLRMRPPLAR